MARGEIRQVRCVETGEVFPCAAEASRAIGLSKGAVTQALHGYVHTVGGYHWEYADDLPVKQHKQSDVPSVKAQAPRPRSAPMRTIPEVVKEAKRRTAMTGVYTDYADIQKEETVQLIREGKIPCRSKNRKR